MTSLEETNKFNISNNRDHNSCCKSYNDSEIDCLLSIINYYFVGDNLITKYKNLNNFIYEEFLNPSHNNYIGNFGFSQ